MSTLPTLACAAFACASALAAPAPSAPPTFYKDIAPIVYSHCAPCHRPGEAGPFPLLSYSDVRRHARQIASVTEKRFMPPWLPEHGYGDFEGDRRLSDSQIALFKRWSETGALPGSPSDAPPAPTFTPGWQLGQPDLVLHASQPFTVPASGPDVFWNFIFPLPIDGPRYVRAVEIRPGNPRIFHHANLLPDAERSARLLEKSPGAGFPGMDLTIETNAFDPDGHFLFWKPGGAPMVEPDGMAWKATKGMDLVLNAHLQTSGKPEQVAPTIGIYFTSAPQTKFPFLVQLEHDGALDIPAGDADFVVTDHFRLPLDADLLAVYPHAHYLGTLLEGYATLPDGSRKWLIRIPHWDVNWQSVYRYRQPVSLPKGTTVFMRYHYDNSAANPRNPNHPPARVHSGDQATDEMGHLWLQLLPRGSSDGRAVFQEAVMRRRLEKYPADFSAHFNLGALLLSRRQAAQAIPEFEAALRADPSQPAALTAYGAALVESGRPNDAIPQFQKALDISPAYTNARYNLASTLASAGRLEEASAQYSALLAADPSDTNARRRQFETLSLLGRQLATAGRLADAAARLRQALAINPSDAGLHNNLGILLARQGNAAAAAAEFRAALAADPSLEAARRNLALALRSLGQSPSQGDHQP